MFLIMDYLLPEHLEVVVKALCKNTGEQLEILEYKF